MPIERRLQMVFAALAVVLAATFAVQFVNHEEQVENRQWVQRGRQVIDEIARLQARALEADSAIRAYLLSPDNRYRAQVTQVYKEVDHRLDVLERLLDDNRDQLLRLGNLREIMHVRREAGEELMRRRDSSATEAVTAFHEADDIPGDGALHTVLAEMDQEQRISVEQRREQRLRVSNRIWIFTAASLVGTVFGLLITAYLMVRRHKIQREALERDLREKNNELREASRLKSEFLAHMSHELRTPLNAVIGYTGTLLMKLPGPLTQEQEKQLKTIQTSARHLLSLINDVLDLARIESGKVELELKPMSCQEVMEEVLGTLRPLAQAKHLALDGEFPGEAIQVRADRRALSQVLINLANNAIKFTEKGSVTLRLRQPDAASGAYAAVDVIDTGVGVKPEEQAQLFRAFHQLHAGKPRREGTGLGLYLSGRLAELLQGRIEFESEYGKGSRFTLLIPKA